MGRWDVRCSGFCARHGELVSVVGDGECSAGGGGRKVDVDDKEQES